MIDRQRIRQVLETQGRSVNWLADVTGYHRVSVSTFLNGHQPIPAKFAESAARVMGVPLEWLRSDQRDEVRA